MKIKLDTAVTATLAICALLMTVLVIRREFIPPTTASTRVEHKPLLINDWRSHLAKGVRMGLMEAPVQLLEFSDFECPYCASLHEDLRILRERYPTQLALTYVHLPLSNHRFAEPAARAVECAGEQTRFEAMHDVLFERQGEFGLKPWTEFAAAAGVPDGVAFEACIRRTEPLPRVLEGKLLAEQLNVRGTPTLVINGWKLGRPPSMEELDGMIKAVLAGKNPVPDA